MNKILPIILVVVLSGCAYDEYAGGVKKPFTPDSAKGGTSIFRVYDNLKKTPKIAKRTKTYFVWNIYSQCMNEVENNKDSSIKDFFIDNSFEKIIKCGKKKTSCLSGCSSYENKFIDFADLLLVEVKKGNLANVMAKIELIKYQDDMLEKYKTMVYRQQEKLARLEAAERARQRRIWDITMNSIQDSLDSMQESSRRMTESYKDSDRDRRLRNIENKLDRGYFDRRY